MQVRAWSILWSEGREPWPSIETVDLVPQHTKYTGCGVAEVSPQLALVANLRLPCPPPAPPPPPRGRGGWWNSMCPKWAPRRSTQRDKFQSKPSRNKTESLRPNNERAVQPSTTKSLDDDGVWLFWQFTEVTEVDSPLASTKPVLRSIMRKNWNLSHNDAQPLQNSWHSPDRINNVCRHFEANPKTNTARVEAFEIYTWTPVWKFDNISVVHTLRTDSEVEPSNVIVHSHCCS